jgi:hypothetical protein
MSTTCLAHEGNVGLARIIYIQCMYSIFGRGITKYTVIYGAYTVDSRSLRKLIFIWQKTKLINYQNVWSRSDREPTVYGSGQP